MAEPRLSQKMRAAMKRLYKTEGNSDYVAYLTAIALEARGLISMPDIPSGQRTTGGQFPEYKVTLNQDGQRWCEKHLAKIPDTE